MKKCIFIGVLLMSSCSQSLAPPDAVKKPYEMTTHGDTRVDNYYWMRLSDEQKSAQTYDEHTQEVVDYINLENEYIINNILRKLLII